jgi:hypothetical protein
MTAVVPFIRDITCLQFKQATTSSNSIVKTFPASWVTLLETAALEIKITDRAAAYKHSLLEGIEVDTDHLPSDVRAAPAWMTVRMAVLMTAIAGCKSITKLPGLVYLTARGKYAKLRFREHPDLSTISVFDQLQKTRSYIWAPSQQMDDMLLCNYENCSRVCSATQYQSGFRCQCYLLGDISEVDKHLKARSKDSSHKLCLQPLLARDSEAMFEYAGRILHTLMLGIGLSDMTHIPTGSIRLPLWTGHGFTVMTKNTPVQDRDGLHTCLQLKDRWPQII